MSAASWAEGTNPRDEVQYPPWLWLSLCVVFVACIVFISIRRAYSLELLTRLRQFSHDKLPFLRPSGGIRLSTNDIENPLALDSDSDSNPDDDQDELPFSTPPRPPTIAQRGKQGFTGLLGTLGWTGGLSGNSQRGPGRDAWFQRAFGGNSRLDSSRGGTSAMGGFRSGSRGASFNGILDRVTHSYSSPTSSYSSSNSPSRAQRDSSLPSSPRVSSSPRLFDLGEEDENPDAVELPAGFTLSNKSPTL